MGRVARFLLNAQEGWAVEFHPSTFAQGRRFRKARNVGRPASPGAATSCELVGTCNSDGLLYAYPFPFRDEVAARFRDGQFRTDGRKSRDLQEGKALHRNS